MFKNIVCSIWLHTISNSYFSSKCKLLDYSKISYSLLGINTKFSNPCSCIEKDFTICYNSRFVLFFFFNFKTSANDFIVPRNQHLQVWHLVVWGHYENDVLSMIAYISSRYY